MKKSAIAGLLTLAVMGGVVIGGQMTVVGQAAESSVQGTLIHRVCDSSNMHNGYCISPRQVEEVQPAAEEKAAEAPAETAVTPAKTETKAVAAKTEQPASTQTKKAAAQTQAPAQAPAPAPQTQVTNNVCGYCGNDLSVCNGTCRNNNHNGTCNGSGYLNNGSACSGTSCHNTQGGSGSGHHSQGRHHGGRHHR